MSARKKSAKKTARKRTRTTRRNGAGANKQAAFLAALRKTGVITAAAEAAGIDRASHYDWIKDSDYKLKFQAALDEAADRFEMEADRRAVQGVRRLRFFQGKPIIDPATGEPYVEHEYSDVLLMFRLNALRPEKYRKHHEIKHSGEIKGGVLMVPTPVSAAEWAAIAERQQSQLLASAHDLAQRYTVGNGNGKGNGAKPAVNGNGNGRGH